MIIGFVSDIHEDILNLKKAFQKLEKMGCDEIFCLGDIIGYSVVDYNFYDERDASETLNVIKSNCSQVILGNHDLYALRKIPAHQPGFRFPGNWYDLDYFNRKQLSGGKVWLYEHDELSPLISHKHITYLKSLSYYKFVNTHTGKILLSHSIFPDLSGSTTVHPAVLNHFNEHFNYLHQNEIKLSFSGHGHIEGLIIANESEVRHISFGEYELSKTKTQAIIGPCISRGKRRTGFLTFNTDSYTLESIPIE